MHVNVLVYMSTLQIDNRSIYWPCEYRLKITITIIVLMYGLKIKGKPVEFFKCLGTIKRNGLQKVTTTRVWSVDAP